MKDTVLVTGADGFLGSHLVQHLVRRGHAVRASVRESTGWLKDLPEGGDVELLRGDLMDARFCARAVRGAVTVFHMAGFASTQRSFLSPAAAVQGNVLLTQNMLTACLCAEVPTMVLGSSSAVYGPAQYVPMDEGHPLAALSPLAASRIGADMLGQSFHLAYGMNVVVVRPFSVYGPRQPGRCLVPWVVRQSLDGGETISVGNLRTVRDFLYVTDAVAGIILAASTRGAEGMAFNFGTGRGVAVSDVVRKLIDTCGARKEVVQDETLLRPGQAEIARQVCDASRALEILGWRPQFTLDEGLEETVSWMRDNLDRYGP